MYGNHSPNGLSVQLPPGKYSIEFAGGERYVNKIITFEVADKDIDLGKIVLKKK